MQLDPLVNPRSVAIVGATDRGGPGRTVIESLGSIGFTGPIYPVNPKYPTVLNIKCYPSLTDLPEAPDIVVFSIRNPLIPEQMRLAVQRGARAAIIYDAGLPNWAPTAPSSRKKSPAWREKPACRSADQIAWGSSIRPSA